MNAMPISISRSSDILLLKPRKQKLPYVREEEKGYYSVLTNNGDMNYTMLNHIAMEIYSLCDGQTTIDAIVKEICRRYNENNEAQVFKDVVLSLNQLTKLQVLSWKGEGQMSENPFVLTATTNIDEDFIFSLVGENEIRELHHFFLNSFDSKDQNDDAFVRYMWGTDKRDYMSAVLIRQSLYSYYKDFFVLKQGGEIVGAIAVKPAYEQYLNSAVIEFISMELTWLSKCLSEIMDYYSQFPFKQINSIRVRIPISEHCYDNLISCLKQTNFSLEGVQKKEYLETIDLATYVAYLHE